jgi:L-ascorbate metabolism protein UlaG (beta-lactamase superfamily)
MEITWLGHSCFKIRGKEATVVTDPYDETIGYSCPRLSANIVTVSHGHPGHSYLSRIDGNPKVIRRPGEYEIKGVFIMGLSNFHDAQQGSQRGKNVAYLIEMEDVRLCHLGDLGHLPSSRQVEELSDPGVLFVPVGGVSTTDAKMAAEIVRLLRPRVVIPMHYGTAVVPRLEPLSEFIKEMGLREVLPQPKISITSSNLPQETKVVVLDYLPQ